MPTQSSQEQTKRGFQIFDKRIEGAKPKCISTSASAGRTSVLQFGSALRPVWCINCCTTDEGQQAGRVINRLYLYPCMTDNGAFVHNPSYSAEHDSNQPSVVLAVIQRPQIHDLEPLPVNGTHRAGTRADVMIISCYCLSE